MSRRTELAIEVLIRLIAPKDGEVLSIRQLTALAFSMADAIMAEEDKSTAPVSQEAVRKVWNLDEDGNPPY